MSYVSQIIVFALALMGTLFQSTKTDADGKTIYTKSGLPVLTTVGKVVVTLLVISFGISMLSVRQGEMDEGEARERARRADEKLALVEEYNRGMKDTLDRVFVQNKELTDDQKRQFAAVLGEQKQGGEELAGRIGDTADLLRSRIEGSSNLLRGRLDSSIDVLNRTAGNIASLSDPIRVIQVSTLMLEVPLTHPALEGYRRRLEAGVRELLATPDELARPNRYRLGRWSFGNLRGIAVWPGSPLLPDPDRERAATAVLTEANMDILLYRTPQPAERLADPSPPEEDISVWVNTCMKRLRRPLGGGPCDVDQLPEFDNFSLAYDPDGRRAFLTIFRLKFSPPSSVARPDSGAGTDEWSKRAGGRINGSPDLAGSQVVVRLGPLYANLNVPADIRNGLEYDAIDQIRRQIRVGRLGLSVSEQFGFSYVSDEMFEPGPRSPFTLRLTQRADRNGFPFYFHNLPGTMEELLNPAR